MYLYLYDSFLIDPKYRKLIDKIETRLTDLDINGRMVRLTILKNAKEVIKENLKHEVKTVVAIGSEDLFIESALSLANTGVVLGFIPIGKSLIAEILDIPLEDLACEVLSARRIETLDMGRINGELFLNSVQIDNPKVDLNCDELYRISPFAVKSIKIVNLDWLNFTLSNSKNRIKKIISNPKDGFLEVLSIQKFNIFSLLLKRKEKKDSLFYVKKIEIIPKKEEISLIVDKRKTFKAPALIEVVPNCLKIIVGRDRLI